MPLDRYQDFIQEWILEGHKHDWKPNVYGQVKSWVDDGLKPRAVTRDLDWGIPVPVEGGDGKVLYVWFDAPIGYISSTKEWAKREGKDWEPYWKEEATELVHFIGKDNIVFHFIIFPCILKASKDYILPENVPANEFLNLEGNKISTSKNWAVGYMNTSKSSPGKKMFFAMYSPPMHQKPKTMTLRGKIFKPVTTVSWLPFLGISLTALSS